MPLEMQPCLVYASQTLQLPGFYLGCFSPPSLGSCVHFDSCQVPERRFGDFAFGSLVSFYFPPLFPLTDRRVPSASGLCYISFLGPRR